MDSRVVAKIDARLDDVERAENVRIGFAIESGSRAWGFPSPDSDYDCRFVFVRPSADYLSLFPKRDVIETELTPVFDVNGWDIAKALRLLLNGNAVIIEWLTSPISYRADAAFTGEFLDLAHHLADRERIARHYIHLGRNVLENKLGELDDVPIKKLFYALRPAIALRWLTLNPQERIAPMNFQALCAGADLPTALSDCIGDLLRRKAVTRELGRGPMPAVIRETILRELDKAERRFTDRTARPPQDFEQADQFFRKWIAKFENR
jgi:predicted nucleotidyltransferase